MINLRKMNITETNPDHLEHGDLRPPPALAFLLSLARSTPLGRGKCRRALRNYFVRNGVRKFDAEIDNIKLRVHLVGNACEWKFACHRGYIRSDLAFLVSDIDCKAARFLDIGANAGIFSLSLAAKGSRVVAVECHPVALERLRFNVRANDFGKRITIVESAAGESFGSMQFAMNAEDIGSSNLIGAEKSEDSISIEVRPLADIVTAAGLDRVDGLKIDVEGFEDRVLIPYLRDAPKALWPRRIVIEHVHRNRWQEDCIHALCAAGFAVRAIEGNNTHLSLS